ncbi:MAG: glycosyltransferase family 4 protein, partial [Candidatus Helarchaeota archaeon]
LSIILKKKIITMAYGLDFLVKSRFSLKTYFFRAADKIIVITNQTKRLIKKIHNLNENKIKVIYIGVNLKDLEISGSKEELRNQFNIPLDLKMILSVGRHVARKNFDLVIRAIKEIKKIRPNLKIKYYLIGDGPETERLKKLVKELKLEKNVEFLGRCDVTMRNKFYKMSDIFIMPSITRKKDIEGFGLVFLEANYFKVPVIGTKSGGIVEAVIDGVTGFLIEQNNLNELIEKILILLDNEELRSKLGENGQKRVIKNFQWDFLINDYVNLFKEYME